MCGDRNGVGAYDMKPGCFETGEVEVEWLDERSRRLHPALMRASARRGRSEGRSSRLHLWLRSYNSHGHANDITAASQRSHGPAMDLSVMCMSSMFLPLSQIDECVLTLTLAFRRPNPRSHSVYSSANCITSPRLPTMSSFKPTVYLVSTAKEGSRLYGRNTRA